MKKYFTSKEGKIITAKEWFAENSVGLSVPLVSEDMVSAEDKLQKIVYFEIKYLGIIELAIQSALTVRVRQPPFETRHVYITSSGEVEIELNYICDDAANRKEVIAHFKKILERIKTQQQEIVDKANATFIEV